MPYNHQLETTDEQFLDHLKLPGALGQRLDCARRDGDMAAARGIVAEHFRTRGKPAWSYYSHGSPWHETDAQGSVLDKARKLLRHRFRNSWAPHQWMDLDNGSDAPDWQRGLEQAGTSISRGTWLAELTTAFALTGDRGFAAKAIALIRSFTQACPFVLDPRFVEDHDTYFGGPGNSTQVTSYRLFRMADLLHSGVMHLPRGSAKYEVRSVKSQVRSKQDAPGAPHFARRTSHFALPSDDVFWLVKQIWFCTMQFYRLLDDPLRRDNHHLLDHGHLPFAMGLAFPEFSCSAAMLKAGTRVIRYHVGHNLLADGAYAEHSAEYQYHVIFHYLHPYGLAKANGYKLLTDAQVKALRKWVEFSARCSKPDGMLPAIGDSPGRPLLHLFGSLAAPVMDAKLAAMARGLGCVPGTHQYASAGDVARAMTKWRPGQRLTIGVSAYYENVGTRTGSDANSGTHDAGQLPVPATCQYPHGGYTFFRSAWHPQADYLSVSHFTGDYGTHAHWDMMSFILHTQGKTLIGEPASWLYLDRRFYGHGGDAEVRSPKSEVRSSHFPLRTSHFALRTSHHRGYSYAVNSHNCLVMNDDTLKPLEAMSHGTFWGGWPPRHGLGLFQAGGPIEVAEAWHDANHPTRHRRFFVHVVGIGFVLVDLLSKRPNLAPHEYAQAFHFEGDVKIAPQTPKDGQTLRAHSGKAACLIVPGAETHCRWRTFRDPYLQDVHGVKSTGGSPWVAQLVRRIRGEAVFSHFILTGEAAANRKARCRYLGGTPGDWLEWQSEGISANALDLGEAGTLLVACAPYGKPVESDELSTDAELAVVHLDSAGKVKAWAMVRGGQLTVAGKRLGHGRAREWTTQL
ncbi:MAG: heparinase II/III family protein [Phycisphaeraceae bacterium]